MNHGGLIVDWNSAMKIARREAGIKELLMKARQEMFYLALDEDSYIRDDDFEYLMQIAEEWQDEYETDLEYDQANQLKALIKESRHEQGFDQYELVNQFLEFLEIEFEFYNGLGKKYDRLLNVTKEKPKLVTQMRVPMYHNRHGWI